MRCDETSSKSIYQVNRWWGFRGGQQGHIIWKMIFSIHRFLQRYNFRNDLHDSNLQCQGCDETATVLSGRIHTSLEPPTNRRGEDQSCPTACRSSRRHGRPTRSWQRHGFLWQVELLHWSILDSADLFQPLDHPPSV